MNDDSDQTCWTPWQRQAEVLEIMLRERGYSHIRPIMKGNDPLLVASCRDGRDETMLCFFSTEGKLSVKTLRKIRSEGKEHSCRHILIATQEGITPFASRELVDTMADDDVEIFRRAELAFPVTRHHLVPKHELLTPAEKRDLLERIGTPASSLPKISEHDAVARYLHLTLGQVVRVSRSFGSLEPDPYYRVVV